MSIPKIKNMILQSKKWLKFDTETGLFVMSDEPEDYTETDVDEDIKHIEIEIAKAMHYICENLELTSETKKRLR